MNRRDRLRRLGEIQRVMDSLRQPEEAPDFSQSILARVDETQEFIPPKARTWVVRWRLAAILLAGSGALGIACSWRYASDYTTVASKPTPVSHCLEVGCSAAQRVGTIVDTLERANDTQPAQLLLAISVDTPAVGDGGPCAGRVAALPCPVPPCCGSRAGLTLPTEVLGSQSAEIEFAAAAEPGSDIPDPSVSFVLAGMFAPAHEVVGPERTPPIMLAGELPAASRAATGPKRSLAESLAPLLWGGPSRSGERAGFGAGLPK